MGKNLSMCCVQLCRQFRVVVEAYHILVGYRRSKAGVSLSDRRESVCQRLISCHLPQIPRSMRALMACCVDQLPKRVAVIAALILCIALAHINKSIHFGDAGGHDAPEEGCYTSSYL